MAGRFRRKTGIQKNIHLALLLGMNGGYVDTVGFLALEGPLTAHVSGNFVAFGAAVSGMRIGGSCLHFFAGLVFCPSGNFSRPCVSCKSQDDGR